MKLRVRELSIMLAMLLLMAACNGNKTPTVVVIVPSATAGAKVPTRMPTSSPLPITQTPTETLTPTSSVPMAQAVRSMSVRGGPGSSYPVVGTLDANAQLEITGISEDGSWYQVKLSDGTLGWLASSSAVVTTFGNIAGVSVALEPTNTPTDTPAATSTLTATATETATFTPTATETLAATETSTATRTPIPSPTAGVPQYVSAVLGEVGVAQDTGYLAEEKRQDTVDNSGQDNLVSWNRLDNTYSDFVLAATIGWGEGATDDYCGFTFRDINQDGDKNTLYAVHINRLGRLWFAELTDSVWGDNNYGNGEFVKIDASDTNELILVAVGDTFSVYINGHYSAQFQDDTLKNGLVGLMGGTYESSDKSDCTFSDAFVYSLDSAVAPPAPTPTSPAAFNEAIGISYGNTMKGTIGGDVAGGRYTFAAQSGDVVSIKMSRDSGDLDPQIIVLDAAGNELTRNDDTSGQETRDALIDSFSVPADGNYTIIATRYQENVGLSAGDYSLTLDKTN
ncbi:MAG: SH3 domain-containing protein [Chloroflexota bacterium]